MDTTDASKETTSEVAPAGETSEALVKTESTSDPFSVGRIFGVALLGAFGSMAAYYLYHQLEPDHRKRIRSTAVEAVKGQVRSFVA